MKKSRGWLVTLLFVVAATPLPADDATVGDRRVDQILVEGAKAFQADLITRELSLDLDVAHASAREASLERLKTLLAEKTSQGYLMAGFAQVKVDVRDEGGRLILAVNEGPRFLVGEIRVRGTTAIAASELKDAWPAGKPARLDSLRFDELNVSLKKLFREHGYYRARFSVDRDVRRDALAVDLRVTVTDLGPPMRARDIEAVGDERVSLDKVLDFLTLEKDVILTKEVQGDIEERLNDSGRFLSVDLQPVVPDDTAQVAHLKLSLLPYDKAPPLNAPLSREQAALVKFAVWSKSVDHGQDDIGLTLKMGPWQGEIVGSPRFGMLGWITGMPRRAGGRDEPAPAFDLAIVESEEEVGIYSFRRKRCLTTVPAPARFLASMEVVVASGPPEPGRPGTLKFGVGLKSHSKQDRRHCKFQLKQTAVGALALAFAENVTFAWNGDLLTVTADGWRSVIHEGTGRLVEHARVAAEGELTTRLFADPDEFKRQLRDLQAAAGGLQNDADGDRPLSCVAEYAIHELEQWTSQDNLLSLARVLQKLVARGALKPIDDELASRRPDAQNEDAFSIPRVVTAVENLRTTADIANFMARGFGIQFGDRFAPRDSWPWKLWREVMFLAAKMPSRLDHAVPYLQAVNAGPVHCWAGAVLLKKMGHNAESRACAQAGLDRLDADAFRRDCDPILVPGHWLGDYVLHLAGMLRELDEEEAATLKTGLELCGYTDGALASSIVDLAGRLREEAGRPLSETLAEALDHAWRNWLRERLETSLNELSVAHSPAELQKLLERAFKSPPAEGT